MCAQFFQRIPKLNEFASNLKILKPHLIFDERTQLRERVLPHTNALVLSNQDNKIQLETMSFSLIPAWSKERKIKYATHNARLETVDEKPSFRDAFTKRHCIVPISGFIEPVYAGSYSGNMVEFFPTTDSFLFAVGIWEEWVDKSQSARGEILRSFSIITTEPLKFVKEAGHDRSPIFVSEKDADIWLRSAEKNPTKLKSYLKMRSYEAALECRIDRALKSKVKR